MKALKFVIYLSFLIFSTFTFYAHKAYCQPTINWVKYQYSAGFSTENIYSYNYNLQVCDVDRWGNTIILAKGISFYYQINGIPYSLNLPPNFNNGNLIIIKIDSNGNYTWVKHIEPTSGSSFMDNIKVKTDKSGNIYIHSFFENQIDADPGVGVSNLYGTSHFILKLDSNGNYIYAKKYLIKDFTIDNDGRLLITGNFTGSLDFDPGPNSFNLTSTGGIDNSFVTIFDSVGNFISAKKMGEFEVKDIMADHSNNILISGFFTSSRDFNPDLGVNTLSASNTDVFFAKYSSNLDFIYVKSIDCPSNNYLWRINQLKSDDSSNFYITGEYVNTMNVDPGNSNYFLPMNQPTYANPVTIEKMHYSFLCKYDSIGNFKWAKSVKFASPAFNGNFDIDRNNIGLDLDIDSNGMIIWIGECFFKYGFCEISQSNGPSSTLIAQSVINDPDKYSYFIKLSPNGNTIYSRTSKLNTYLGIGHNEAGTKYVLSHYYSTGGSYNVLLYPGGVGTILPYNLGFYLMKLGTCSSSSSNLSPPPYCGSAIINGQTYTSSGVYTQLFTNANGCDSLVTLNLTIIPSTSSSISATSCNSYIYNGQTYTSSGVYTDTLINVAGCDSIVTLNLTINQSSTASLTATSCDSYTYNGQAYTSSGVYTDTLINLAGCDSIVTLNLTINQSSTASLTATSCDSYTYNGQTYTSSGVYTDTLINLAGCDSIVTLNLTINQNPIVSIAPYTDTTICIGTPYVLIADSSFVVNQWSVNGVPVSTNDTFFVNTSGSYILTSTDTNGCMGTDTVNIIITPAPQPVIVQTGTLLTCTNVLNVNYQWYLNSSAVGTNDSILNITQDGTYVVITTDSNDCIGIDTLTVIGLGLIENTISNSNVYLYPNPTTGMVTVSHPTNVSYISILDLTGRELMQLNCTKNSTETIVQLSNLPNGIYQVKIGAYVPIKVLKL